MSIDQWEGSPKRISLQLSPKNHAMLKKFSKDNGMSVSWLVDVLLSMNMAESLPGVKKMLQEGVIPASRERYILDEFYGLYKRSYREKETPSKPRLKESKKGTVRTRGRGKFNKPEEGKDA